MRDNAFAAGRDWNKSTQRRNHRGASVGSPFRRTSSHRFPDRAGKPERLIRLVQVRIPDNGRGLFRGVIRNTRLRNYGWNARVLRHNRNFD